MSFSRYDDISPEIRRKSICKYCKEELYFPYPNEYAFCSKECYEMMIAEVIRSARGDRKDG
jgi:hypothetical protein